MFFNQISRIRDGTNVQFSDRELDRQLTNLSKFVETMKRNISAADYKKLLNLYAPDSALFANEKKVNKQ